ncbi:hypothetical protein HHK36_001592 [Tetracentron sinense]|uniref:UDP-N-acetylglucosamine transferase subunit ALG14 n=1 Tax=Tetracentron sinense TaxID=13715 RepID=A0A834ZTP6_TETSI|nr:hypothetical protein HHK36_001592 [Tetracentron sinense]
MVVEDLIIAITITAIVIRILYVVHRSSKPLSIPTPQPISTLIVLGSGGHTAEMLNLVSLLQKDRFTPRFYIAASTDNMSAGEVTEPAQFMQIYRSREILCNGPGTCIPLCVAGFLFKVVGIQWSSIFYVESIARVRRISLSGLLLYKLCIADQFFVQWSQLQRKYPNAHSVGCLM